MPRTHPDTSNRH